MSDKASSTINLALIIGTLGFLAGIGLLFTDSWVIGIFGSIAGGGLAYIGYRDSKASNS